VARPRKCRKVCCMPVCTRFGPLDLVNGGNNCVVMTVDEYETIRLIDLEGLNQEECSNQMNVARTTVQSIYDNARKKLSDSLVNGKVLRIEGGEYKICDEFIKPCGKEGCFKRKCDNQMKPHLLERND